MPDGLTRLAIVTEQAHRGLDIALTTQCTTWHLTCTASLTDAKYRLIIEKDAVVSQWTNISASTTPRQYELMYTVYFRLTDHTGRVLIPASAVRITRPLTINNDRILGSNAEERTMIREMQQDAARQIFSIMGVCLSHPLVTHAH